MKMQKAINFHPDREMVEWSRVLSEAYAVSKILWEGLTMVPRTHRTRAGIGSVCGGLTV